jgi:hypothetical protein
MLWIQTGYPTLRAFVEFAGEFDINSAAEQKTSKAGNFEDARTSSLHMGEPFAPSMFDVVLQNFSPDQPPRSTGRPRYSRFHFSSFPFHCSSHVCLMTGRWQYLFRRPSAHLCYICLAAVSLPFSSISRQ